MRGMGGHHRAYRGQSDVWLTPPEIIEALGPFDLDPCAPWHRPWKIADRTFTEFEDGLWQPWDGRVWCNPPYGPLTGLWMGRMADHAHGTALIFARTETEDFQSQVWGKAAAMLFIRGRLYFHHASGERAKCNSGAPSVLVAYGDKGDAERLRDSGIPGRFIWNDRSAAA